MASSVATLEEWIAREAISFDVGVAESLHSAVDRLIATLGDSVELLGLGEPMHGCEDFLLLRNRLFERLVEAHGYTAIAIESSFTRAQVANEFIAGRGAEALDAVLETGFSHGFGKSAANRELIEWMRAFNSGASHTKKLAFYGFDSPTEMMFADSPRRLLHVVLDYLAADTDRIKRIEALIGADADWENPASAMDPSKGIGGSPDAVALRIETEELVTELAIRRPELVAKTDALRYAEAARYAALARQMLTYHAELARPSNDRVALLLKMRDAMMADNLDYIVARERSRGKVLAFAHNSHLKCGLAEWEWGPQRLSWWPAGAHVQHMLGPRYAVIGVGVGMSDRQGIGPPEPGSLEARLTASPGPARVVSTLTARSLLPAMSDDLPARSKGKNPGYFPFSAASLTDFDALIVLDCV